MTEKPILFRGPMVRAILSGQKTVTRRVVKPQPPVGTSYVIADEDHRGRGALCVSGVEDGGFPKGIDPWRRSPYGVAGDRLWVRETWWKCPCDCDQIVYREKFDAGGYPNLPVVPSGWRPSIFMQRSDSRITLEVVSVRVEQLHAITEEDAIREGVDAVSVADVPRNGTLTRRDDFAQLWQKINRKRAPWASNPFVWRVEFKVLKACRV